MYVCPECQRKVRGVRIYFGKSYGEKRKPRGWVNVYDKHTWIPRNSKISQLMRRKGWEPILCKLSYKERI